MTDGILVRAFDVTGGPLCVSTEDGQLLHDKIAPLLRAGHRVIVSFENVETIISAYMNASIGQLYGELPEEAIRELLSVDGLTPQDVALLKRVVENAKMYFKNRRNFDTAWKHEVGSESESDEE